jgi:large subunit ribosomal protein L31e
MKAGETRTYTIPLRKEFLKAARWRRSKKAVSVVRSFVIQHTKSEEVKVGRWLNETIWKRGSKNPPSRVRVDVKKEENYSSVELSELPRKANKTETKIEDKIPEEEKKETKPKVKKTPVKKPVVKKETKKKSTSTKTKKK